MAVSNDVQHSEREHFFGAARLVAALTLMSRILGLVRDMAVVSLGATRATDVFWTAFTVPNLLRRLFGEGALSAAFVPVFTEVSRTEGWDRARLVLANVAGWTAMILISLLVIAEVGLSVWLWLAPGEWDRQLLLQLLRIVMPFMITICLLALGSAALNCKGHFGYPAFAPIILNVVLIAAAVIVHKTGMKASEAGLAVLAGSVIVGGIAQVVLVVWLLRRAELVSLPSLRPLLPETKRIAGYMLPMMIPLGLLQFSAFFDRIYAYVVTATETSPALNIFGWHIDKPLTEGVVTCLYTANRLYQLPLGVLAISLATVVFPLFSRYAAAGDIAGLRNATNRALRLGLFLGIPSGAGLILLAKPLATIFQRGEFTPADVDRTAMILQMYCVGMWAYFCNHVLLRAFFSMKDTRTPLLISCALAVVNVAMVAVLVFTPLKGAAIGLVTAITASINMLALTAVLRAKLGRLGLTALLQSLARTVAATALMAAAVWWVHGLVADASAPLAERWGIGWLDDALNLLAPVAAGAAVFLIAAKAMRSRELAELRRKSAEA